MVNKVCKRGHANMYDKFRKCTECNRTEALARYYANRSEINAQTKAARKANPAKHKTKDRATYAVNRVTILSNAKRRRATNPAKELYTQAKRRAKKQGCPFTITEQDILVPKHCPLLGIELKIGVGRVGPASPTLDKIIPAFGYVPGNVVVMSHRANAIKNNATLAELQMLVKNWERRPWELMRAESGTAFVRVVKPRVMA